MSLLGPSVVLVCLYSSIIGNIVVLVKVSQNLNTKDMDLYSLLVIISQHEIEIICGAFLNIVKTSHQMKTKPKNDLVTSKNHLI